MGKTKVCVQRSPARSSLGSMLVVMLLGAALSVLVVGCGGSQGSSSGEEGSSGENTSGGATTAGTTGDQTPDETTESIRRPYTAVVPADATGASSSPGDALVAGAQDPSDGPLKRNRLVAYYGNPRSAEMGVLGESDPETMMAQLKEQTLAYSTADPSRPAVPTIELIASTAQRDPGDDGSYLGRLSKEEIEKYASLAEENRALLLLDVQLGLNKVDDEIQVLRPFLERPYVHLAIDTEYHVWPGQVPGVDLGGVDGSEIESAVQTLNRLVEENGLPPKVLVVHQFDSGIVTNKQQIQPTENVEVALNADGFGLSDSKVSKYDQLVRNEPIQYGGFKLFYKQDTPLLGPEQVLKLNPVPVVVNYQ